MADAIDTAGSGQGTGAERDIPRITKAFKFAFPHRVRFDQVDAQGIVGSGGWLDVLQIGRNEYLRNLGLLSLEGGNAPIQAVVRNAGIEYLAAARFDDPLLVRVRASYLGHKSCKFEYLVDNVESAIRHVVGETLLVCVTTADFKSVQWPRVWRDRVSEFEGEDLRVRSA